PGPARAPEGGLGRSTTQPDADVNHFDRPRGIRVAVAALMRVVKRSSKIPGLRDGELIGLPDVAQVKPALGAHLPRREPLQLHLSHTVALDSGECGFEHKACFPRGG